MAGRQTTQNESGREEERERVLTPYHVYDVYGYRILSHLETLRAFLVYFLEKEGDRELAEKMKTAKLELKSTRHVKSGLRPGYSDLWVEATFNGEPQRKLRIQIEVKGNSSSHDPLQVWINLLEDAKQELESGEAEAGSLTERMSLLFILGSGRRSEQMLIEEMFDGKGQEYLKDRPLRGGRILVADLMACELEDLVALPDRVKSTICWIIWQGGGGRRSPSTSRGQRPHRQTAQESHHGRQKTRIPPHQAGA